MNCRMNFIGSERCLWGERRLQRECEMAEVCEVNEKCEEKCVLKDKYSLCSNKAVVVELKMLQNFKIEKKCKINFYTKFIVSLFEPNKS